MRRFAYSSVVQLTWHHSTTSLPRILKRSQIDYLFFGGMAGMALRCSDRPIPGVLGPAREGPRAAPAGRALSVGHEDQAVSGKWAIRGTWGAHGLDPLAAPPGAFAQLPGTPRPLCTA